MIVSESGPESAGVAASAAGVLRGVLLFVAVFFSFGVVEVLGAASFWARLLPLTAAGLFFFFAAGGGGPSSIALRHCTKGGGGDKVC